MGKLQTSAVVCSDVTIAGAAVPVFNYYGPFMIERASSFSIIVEAGAGAGVTLDINYAICNSKHGTYFTPSGASLIFDDLGTASIPDAKSFSPVLAPFIKIGIKNNHAATSVTGLTVKLVWQEDIT
jgi:hypothetical protein